MLIILVAGLVVGGIIFLLLAVAGQFVGEIKISRDRQKLARIVGVSLLSCGMITLIALYVGKPPEVPPSPPEIQTPSPPTATWTHTPLTSPTNTAAPTATSTHTPSASPTNTAAPTATSTRTPWPTPTLTCNRAIDQQLASLWNRSRFGCPTSAAHTIWAAWQPFEQGYMFWRSDTDRVVVFFDNHTWTEFLDQWMEGAPIPSRGSPPPGLIAPTRGFGYIWGIHEDVANRIGWALEEEKGFCANIQFLERGLIFHGSTVTFCQDELYNWATNPAFRPLFFAVYNDGTWEQR